MARIEFSRGIAEDVVPDVRLTRAKDGSNGKAIFRFQKPQILADGNTQNVTGMYLVDDEGELVTREVNAKFVDGEPWAIEAIYVMRSAQEWDRFMRFMERYAEEHGLGFSKA